MDSNAGSRAQQPANRAADRRASGPTDDHAPYAHAPYLAGDKG